MNEKLQSIVKGALVAGAGAALTAVVHYLGSVDWGPQTPVMVALLSVAVNVIRKYLEPAAPTLPSPPADAGK